jgi:hypothetical protein
MDVLFKSLSFTRSRGIEGHFEERDGDSSESPELFNSF